MGTDMREDQHTETCEHCGGSFIADVASSMIAAQLCRIADALEDQYALHTPVGMPCRHGQKLEYVGKD